MVQQQHNEHYKNRKMNFNFELYSKLGDGWTKTMILPQNYLSRRFSTHSNVIGTEIYSGEKEEMVTQKANDELIFSGQPTISIILVSFNRRGKNGKRGKWRKFLRLE